jgi:mannonate dehydratase
MKVLLRQCDLSDEYIRFAQQIGADGIDIHNAQSIPGFIEQGYPDLESLRAIKQRINDANMVLCRIAPQDDALDFMLGKPGGEKDIENLKKTIEILGELDIPFLSTPFNFENPGHRGGTRYGHRGGYAMGGTDLDKMKQSMEEDPWVPTVSIEDHWKRSIELLKALVPVAEKYNVKLITHPSDPPLSNSHLSPQRWTDLMEAVPSTHNGMLYCVGTRYESGVDICEDIRYYAAKGWIFHTHIRNVKGQLPTHGCYQEVAMDDGSMNMFTVLKTLQDVGFDGGLQLDHMPSYDYDDEHRKIAWGYAVGYVKALLRALRAP